MHDRRSIRLRGYDYSRAGAYFVTHCAYRGECLFGEVVEAEMRPSGVGLLVQRHWAALPERFPTIDLDAFVVMPNHVHGIVLLGANPVVLRTTGSASGAPTDDRSSTTGPKLGDVMRAFKSISGIEGNRLLGRSGPLWQRNYYEHIIRNDRSLERIRRYIANNPANWATDEDNPSFTSSHRLDATPR